MRIYLAGPSAELPRVKHWAEALELHHLEITHRWWQSVEDPDMPHDSVLSAEQQLQYARADLRGIDCADVVWALWPTERGRSMGTAIEIGYALAKGRPLFVTGERALESIFGALAKCRSTSDEMGLQMVLAFRRGAL
jgi:nucleoside 2-deoxyribosyltransferase